MSNEEAVAVIDFIIYETLQNRSLLARGNGKTFLKLTQLTNRIEALEMAKKALKGEYYDGKKINRGATKTES